MEKTLAPFRPDRRTTAVRIARELGAFVLLSPVVVPLGYAAFLAIWATAYPEMWIFVALLVLVASGVVVLAVGFRRVTADVHDVGGVALRWAGFALLNPAVWWWAYAVLVIG